MSAAMEVDFVSTSVRIPRETLAVLRRAAAERAIARGGQISISAVVVELAERLRRDAPTDASPEKNEDHE